MFDADETGNVKGLYGNLTCFSQMTSYESEDEDNLEPMHHRHLRKQAASIS